MMSRGIYYISGNTAILAKDLGRALLSQFPDLSYREEYFPFVNSMDEARRVRDIILKDTGPERPLVISSLFSPALNDIFCCPEIHLIKVFDGFLAELETLFGMQPLRKPKRARTQDPASLTSRVQAIDYTIHHDDGTALNHYAEAELIILGVSRSGKTPVAMFIATQFGIKVANYPVVAEELEQCRLPDVIASNRDKAVGLVMSAETLNRFRESRLPGSRYASLENCMFECRTVSALFSRYTIPQVESGGSSIEETAMQVLQQRRLRIFPKQK